MFNVEKALQELSEKTYRQIQEETAWTWLSRAAASYQNCLEEEPSRRLVCWTLGEEYYHEAIEHGALTEGNENLVQELREAVRPYQEKAAAFVDYMVNSSKEETDAE